MLLAIDTSTSLASVALVATPEAAVAESDEPANPRPALLAELTWEVGARHSVELLQRIEWLLATQGAGMASLTALAVATGPGSFNGVRVAVTTAKSLAFALGLPVAAHATLDVIAWGAGPAAGPRWALLDAGRGEVYAARYAAPPDATDLAAVAAWAPTPLTLDDADAGNAGNAGNAGYVDQLEAAGDGAAPDRRAGYHLLTPPQVAALIAREGGAGAAPLLCGEWRAPTRAALATALAAVGAQPRFVATPRRAWSLAELALARLATRGAHVATLAELAALEPLYLRRPAITTSAKRALQAAH